MKNIIRLFIFCALLLCITTHLCAQSTSHSQEAIKQSGKAGSAASKGSIHAIAASGQAASAASAVPFLASGAAGALSEKVGDDLLKNASQPIGRPLEITEEVITAGPPPDQALKVKQPQDR
jgi:hypothetical protein